MNPVDLRIELPPGTALVRDRRTRATYLARNLRETSREVTFDGELLLRDVAGMRLYPSRPRRLSPARVEILDRRDAA